MTDEELKAIEAKAKRWAQVEGATVTTEGALALDALTLVAEVKRLRAEAEVVVARQFTSYVAARYQAQPDSECRAELAKLREEEARRSRRIIDFCVEACQPLGLNGTDWHNADFETVLAAIKRLRKGTAPRIVAALGGGDRTDATVRHLRVPAGLDIKALEAEWKALDDALNRAALKPQIFPREKEPPRLSFPDWLIANHGAESIQVEEIEEW